MNFKKIFVPCSAIALSALALSGCGSPEDASKQALTLPADKFDLSKWKIAIPTDLDNNGKVDEISVEGMQTFQHPDYFYADAEGNMVFSAPNKAFTTPNSSNTRSELHQLLDSATLDAKAPSNNFTVKSNKRASEFGQIGGNLQATLNVNHVAKRAGNPEKYPAFSVVVGQIHAGKDAELIAEGEGYGWGNEPLKIYFKKFPDHEYGSVFWTYERNLAKKNPVRKDIAYPVWGNTWDKTEKPGEQGIALNEDFSYEVNVVDDVMSLTFTTARHGSVSYTINLANNIDANGKLDEFDHPHGYAGDWNFFKAGAYNQCSTKDAEGFWYAACLGTGDWATDKANGDYTQVTFKRLETSVAK